MVYALRHQPVKGLYLIYQLLSTFLVRIPLWVLFSLPRSWRPRESWDLKRVFWVHLIRHLFNVTNKTGPFIITPNHLAITPGVGVNGIWVEPASELIIGELKTWATVASVSGISIPGYWLHKKGTTIKVGAPPVLGEKIVYALHGGAYIRLSAHPADPTAAIARGLLQHVDPVQRVFSIEYRLSSTNPFTIANPFPTALLDALAGYNYLVNVAGFSPSDIIIEGDSAGGNLALALTRYLTEYKDTPDVDLPAPPGALLLLSPWCDLGASHVSPRSSSHTLLASDYIGNHDGSVDYARDAFIGPHDMGAVETNRYISPASRHPSLTIDFTAFPRTFIVAGGAEVLLDSIRTLKDKMIKDLGEGNGVREGEGKVRYLEVKDGVHDYLVFAWHEPERTDTLKEIARWAVAS